MGNKLADVLDYCITRTAEGESIEDCASDCADMKEQIEPLLRAAAKITSMPKAAPSEEFRNAAPDRLKARLYREAAPTKTAILEERTSLLESLAMAARRFWQANAGARKVAVAASLTLLLVVVATVGASNLLSPTPALASQCTLSILGGNVQIQAPDGTENLVGADGMTLSVGMHVRTDADSRALLTFFDGSTIALEPGTDLEIQQLERSGQSINIVLKQWAGRTWSRVVKMADPGSHYQIETPSACAIVRGTLFTTEVSEDGATKVATTQGLVSVVAQNEEVFLPANVETVVKDGQAPSRPVASPSPAAEIIITIDNPALASVVDPSGASTGSLPAGVSFNQIPGSQSVLSEGTQVISIPQPKDGDYTIALRYQNQGTAHINIQGKSNGQTGFEYAGNHEGGGEGGWLIRVSLNVENGVITGGQVSGIESFTGEPQEKPANRNATVKKTASTESPGQQDSQPGFDNELNNGKEDNQGQDQEKVAGNSGDDNGKQDNEPGQVNTDDKDQGQAKEASNGKEETPSAGPTAVNNEDKGRGQNKEAVKDKEETPAADPGAAGDEDKDQGQDNTPSQGSSGQGQSGTPGQGNTPSQGSSGQGQSGTPGQGNTPSQGSSGQGQGNTPNQGSDPSQGNNGQGQGNTPNQGSDPSQGNNGQGQGNTPNQGSNPSQGSSGQGQGSTPTPTPTPGQGNNSGQGSSGQGQGNPPNQGSDPSQGSSGQGQGGTPTPTPGQGNNSGQGNTPGQNNGSNNGDR